MISGALTSCTDAHKGCTCGCTTARRHGAISMQSKVAAEYVASFCSAAFHRVPSRWCGLDYTSMAPAWLFPCQDGSEDLAMRIPIIYLCFVCQHSWIDYIPVVVLRAIKMNYMFKMCVAHEKHTSLYCIVDYVWPFYFAVGSVGELNQ